MGVQHVFVFTLAQKMCDKNVDDNAEWLSVTLTCSYLVSELIAIDFFFKGYILEIKVLFINHRTSSGHLWNQSFSSNASV